MTSWEPRSSFLIIDKCLQSLHSYPLKHFYRLWRSRGQCSILSPCSLQLFFLPERSLSLLLEPLTPQLTYTSEPLSFVPNWFLHLSDLELSLPKARNFYCGHLTNFSSKLILQKISSYNNPASSIGNTDRTQRLLKIFPVRFFLFLY